MNKSQIIAALLAAGVTEANETMTVDALKALAAERGVSLKPAVPVVAEVNPDGPVVTGAPVISHADDYYDGMRQAKVAAGLSLEQAIEVTARQRAEDEARAKK